MTLKFVGWLMPELSADGLWPQAMVDSFDTSLRMTDGLLNVSPKPRHKPETNGFVGSLSRFKSSFAKKGVLLSPTNLTFLSFNSTLS